MSRQTASLMPRAAATALLLLAVYWLTASGTFHSIDEHAVFAVARNLVFHGKVDESALFWGSPYDAQARVGEDGELYSKYGIGHSLILAVAVALARVIPGAGLVSTAVWVNALATALTAFFLVMCAGRLGYTARTGVVLGLLFGLATFSWVYARTMFGEPLVALGWMVVLWLFLGGVTWKRALVAGLVMAATVLIRPALALAILPFSLFVWDRKPTELMRRLGAFALPVAAVIAGLLAFNQLRFGDPLQFGYSEGFGGSLVTGLVGFLFSADRSLFLFALPLAALFWSAPAFIRRHGSAGWKILAVAGFVLVLYSKWAVFWGGPVWGPRYLLPIVPLLMVLLLPLIDRAVTKRDWSRALLLLLAVFGCAIQLPAVLWNPLPMTQTLGQRYPLWLLRPKADWLDIAWLTGRWEGMLVATGLALLALAALRWPRRWVLIAAFGASLLGSIFLVRWLGESTFRPAEQIAYASALSRLDKEGRRGDALVLNPTPDEGLDELLWFLNEPHIDLPFFGVYRLAQGEDAPSASRVEDLQARYQRLWLLTKGVSPGDPTSTTERHLIESAALVGTWWLEDGVRLSLFETPGPSTLAGAVHTQLGDRLVLERWEVSQQPSDPASLQVTLWYRSLGPSPAELHVFVQALDEGGMLLAGWDGVPHGGFAPSTDWRRGELIQDRVALALPGDWQVGPLQVIAGLYDAGTGQRLTTPEGADAIFLGRLP
jgi:hypothetical protein